MSPTAESEPTLSIRLLWPFARLITSAENGQKLLHELEIGPAEFGDPETRLPRRVVMRALERTVELTGDPTIGIQAGQQGESGDFDALEYAARSRASFGEAIHVMDHYIGVMIDGVDLSLTVEGELARWSWRPTDGAVLPAPANDYVIALALSFSRRNTSVYIPPVEVWLMHERTAYAEACERAFEARVVFGAPCNATVSHRSRLDVSMLHANPAAAEAFRLRIERVLAKLRVSEGIVGRVRDGLAAELRAGHPSMEQTARRLGMAPATLRRRLEEEGTTFSDLVDDFRRELAERHLGEAEPTVSEIAFLLGFSDVRAFARAFRRWTGQSPSEYRAERRG